MSYLAPSAGSRQHRRCGVTPAGRCSSPRLPRQGPYTLGTPVPSVPVGARNAGVAGSLGGRRDHRVGCASAYGSGEEHGRDQRAQSRRSPAGSGGADPSRRRGDSTGRVRADRRAGRAHQLGGPGRRRVHRPAAARLGRRAAQGRGAGGHRRRRDRRALADRRRRTVAVATPVARRADRPDRAGWRRGDRGRRALRPRGRRRRGARRRDRASRQRRAHRDGQGRWPVAPWPDQLGVDHPAAGRIGRPRTGRCPGRGAPRQRRRGGPPGAARDRQRPGAVAGVVVGHGGRGRWWRNGSAGRPAGRGAARGSGDPHRRRTLR